MRRSVLFLSAVSAFLMLAVAQGCGPATCSAMSCKGCCDASGRCDPGITAPLCGRDGSRCVQCPAGAQCLQQVCTIIQGAGGGSAGGATAGGGTTAGGAAGGAAGGSAGGATAGGAAGGSATGGGAAGGSTGGGAPAGCQTVDLIEGSMLRGGGTRTTMSGTQTVWYTAWAVPASLGSPVALRVDVQLYRALGTTPILPARGTFTTATRFSTCNECVQLATACNLQGENCAGGDMIPLAGSFEYTVATSNALAANFQHLVFRPWNLQTDMQRTNDSNCIYVRALRFDATW
ncbi:MAG: hypothetical protein INH41_22585 [Myxococcaceae bacterium]|jgi:hypothetical protein|nr:hypothetical protein [Myxococcaceae bacterium]MCA3015185.1 hypothetical protein [Myxococcaceae bacterium]